MSETAVEIDYTALDASGVIVACGDDGRKWATAFNQHAEKLGHHGLDEGWLIGWFCNAIEGACDTRERGEQGGVPLPVFRKVLDAQRAWAKGLSVGEDPEFFISGLDAFAEQHGLAPEETAPRLAFSALPG